MRSHRIDTSQNIPHHNVKENKLWKDRVRAYFKYYCINPLILPLPSPLSSSSLPPSSCPSLFSSSEVTLLCQLLHLTLKQIDPSSDYVLLFAIIVIYFLN